MILFSFSNWHLLGKPPHLTKFQKVSSSLGFLLESSTNSWYDRGKILNKTYLPDKTDDNSWDNNLLLESVINMLVFLVEAFKEFITSSNLSTFWISSKNI